MGIQHHEDICSQFSLVTNINNSPGQTYPTQTPKEAYVKYNLELPLNKNYFLQVIVDLSALAPQNSMYNMYLTIKCIY